MIRARLATAAVVLLSALALAADDGVKVKGLGTANVRWNTIPYRAELMAQLSPGLTWRLGANGATRLELERMALVGEAGLLLPGEMTLNLRYWSDSRWELVVFEENDWKWSPDKTMFGTFPAEVVQRAATDGVEQAEQLELDLFSVERAGLEPLPKAAVTGETKDDFYPEWEMTPAAKKQHDTAPLVVLDMKFGPHVGRCVFEPVGVERQKGEYEVEGSVVRYEFVGTEWSDVLARTESAEHEEPLSLGLLRLHGDAIPDSTSAAPLELMLETNGGEDVALWPVRRSDGEELEPVFGESVPTKTSPKRVTCELDGSTLVVHLHQRDYRFDLSLLEL